MSQSKTTPSPLSSAIDLTSSEPLYIQIAQRLAEDITSGRLSPGTRVPSEAELMELHGVSRVTVRQAVQLLTRNGQVVPRRGKGTYVARPALQHDLGTLQGFQESLRSQGVEPQTELLEFSGSAGRIDRTLPEGLDLPVRLRRRYCVAGRPFAVVEAFLPMSAAELGERRAQHLAVYDILQQFLGLRISRADVEIRCAAPTTAIAKELGVSKRTNVLVMQRTSFTTHGVACEYMRIHIVPEHYTFKLSLPGPLEIVRALMPAESAASADAGSNAQRRSVIRR